ncbi:hypothetical protein LINGRAHAP2_LOCUS32543 [Linum grandiflorum]
MDPPRLLKDLLREDSTHYSKPHQTNKLIHGIGVMINHALKSMKTSPSSLHRSLSCKLLSRSSTITPSPKQATSVKEVNFTVKDIIRWKSFRDLQEVEAEEESTVTCTECSSSRSSGSKGSSWCESDFSSDQWWFQSRDLADECRKSAASVGGGNFVDATKDKYDNEEDIKQPLPTHLFQSEQDDDSCFNLDGSLTNSESTTDDEDDDSELEGNEAIGGGYEGVFDKAWQLLEQVKSSSTGKTMLKGDEEELLLDFFTDELMMIVTRDRKLPRDEMTIVEEVRDWVNSNGGSDDVWGIGLERRNDGYVKAMDEEGDWSNFGGGEVRKEVGLGVEAGIFGDLITELLLDFS